MSLASRREALSLVVGAGLALAQPAIAADTETPKIPASEMIKPPETSCAQGVGGKCAELSEGNPLIEKLQKRSADNRLKYQKQELESYWNRNYKDFFDYACNAYDKKCDYIQKPDGTWEIGTKPEGPKWNLQETKRAGSGMMN